MGKLTVIGSGDAFSTGGRFQSCFLVEEGEKNFIVDCGANAYVNLVRTFGDLDRLQRIFITHFHGDHYGGIPFILINRRFFGRGSNLEIWAPTGAKKRIRDLGEALYPGLGDELVDQDGLFIREYESEIEFESGGIRVWPVPVVHAPDSIPHGLRISIGEKTMGFSGDTEWNSNILQIAEGTELMMLECNNFSSIRPGHVTYSQIEEQGAEIRTKNLVLNHFGDEMLSNSEKVKGNMAEDGMELFF